MPLLRMPVARAQEPGRIYRLGVITGAARLAPWNVAFFEELKGLGFVEGQNLKFVADGFGLRDDQFAKVAATLAKSAPDVIFCIGNPAIRAARELTRTVPIVGLASEWVAAGFVRSLARPGGNVTGVNLAFEIDGKRQDLLMEAVPDARRFAFLTDTSFTPAGAPFGTSERHSCAWCRGCGLYRRSAGADRANDGRSQGMGSHCTQRTVVRHSSPSIAVSSSSGLLAWAYPRFMNGPKWRKREV